MTQAVPVAQLIYRDDSGKIFQERTYEAIEKPGRV
jgi:hypothetical protein